MYSHGFAHGCHTMIHVLVPFRGKLKGHSKVRSNSDLSLRQSWRCHFLMWARLPVSPSPAVASLFSITTVGKHSMNKHKLVLTMHREMFEKTPVKGKKAQWDVQRDMQNQYTRTRHTHKG